ncbi:MAG: two-component sensor histidine kinase [Firmicutes bacterium]|nr:two-component sensor histidine kinase [Bacillota bacterium]
MSLRLEKQNRELMEKQDNELTMAKLQERNRIAREIHDNVGHLLSSAILQTGALRTVARDGDIKARLNALHDTLAQAMDSTRKSVHALYDEAIDLRAQLEELIAQFAFCEIRFEYGLAGNPPLKVKTAFLAIIKEALANMIKHSDATSASVVLREHPALYQLIIKDNGRVKNYDPDSGMGLKNMVDRVHSLQGIINITTEDGFAIFVSVPKEGIQLEGAYH